MLDYGWGNPSSIMLSGDENGQDGENRQIFDPCASQSFSESANFISPEAHFATAAGGAHHHHHHHHMPYYQTQSTVHHPNPYFPTFYNSQAYASSAPLYPSPAGMLTLEPSAVQNSFMMVPKAEPLGGGGGMEFNHGEFNNRIGLNLGGRTYFASDDDDFVNRLYRRSRMLETSSVNTPRCQVEGCNADLSHAKHYHRRHKVCEFHSKAATVIASGLTQRFCQQCSRFHVLSEFDNGKRSCRKRLADHNRRRRKSQQSNLENGNKSHTENTSGQNSSSENPSSRSPPDSGLHSSSVTVAISPPGITRDCFAHRSYNTGGTTSSTSSLFYSNG